MTMSQALGKFNLALTVGASPARSANSAAPMTVTARATQFAESQSIAEECDGEKDREHRFEIQQTATRPHPKHA